MFAVAQKTGPLRQDLQDYTTKFGANEAETMTFVPDNCIYTSVPPYLRKVRNLAASSLQ